MVRLVGFLIVAAALVLVSVWFAERPGAVTLHWLGWRVDTTVPILLLGLLLVVGVVFVALRLLGRALGVPRLLGRRLERRHLRKGLRALTDGVAALVAEDGYTARKKAAEVQNHLRDAETSRLLLARAALLGDDRKLARDLNEALLENKTTELAGVRGLLDAALAEGRTEDAAVWAERAFRLNPGARWAVRPLFDAQVRKRDWESALKTLQAGRKTGVFPASEADRLKAALFTARSQAAAATGQTYEATRFAKSAYDAESAFVPAVAAYVAALGAEGQTRKGAAIARESWKRGPHPAVATAYMALWADADPIKRVSHAEHLAETNPEHVESRILVATVALEAELWGQARARLKPLIDANERDGRVAHLMARLEEGEHGRLEEAARWLRKAAEMGTPAPWRCGACGTAPESWQLDCPSCGSFGTLTWGAGRAIMTVPAGTTPEGAAREGAGA